MRFRLAWKRIETYNIDFFLQRNLMLDYTAMFLQLTIFSFYIIIIIIIIIIFLKFVNNRITLHRFVHFDHVAGDLQKYFLQLERSLVIDSGAFVLGFISIFFDPTIIKVFCILCFTLIYHIKDHFEIWVYIFEGVSS